MRNAYAAMTAIVGWGALALQLEVVLAVPGDLAIGARVVNLFSSFTILTNVLAASALTVAAFGSGGSRIAVFFGRPTVQTGIVVCTTTAAIVYLALLRTASDATGWALVADLLLHYALPLLYLGFWLLFVTKGTLWLGDLVGFFGFPILYLVYSLVRGPLAHWYPYGLLDVGALGIGPVAVNIAGIGFGLGLVGLAFLGIDRALGRPRGRVALS